MLIQHTDKRLENQNYIFLKVINEDLIITIL